VIHRPAIVSGKQVDDVSFFTVVDAVLVGISPVIVEIDVAVHLAVVPDLGAPMTNTGL
jgi:hypothetical protein